MSTVDPDAQAQEETGGSESSQDAPASTATGSPTSMGGELSADDFVDDDDPTTGGTTDADVSDGSQQ